jgi:tRNA/tmRNA/rRNA uracil-C5-methylase (TrmA/RlmC/RlmD family)
MARRNKVVTDVLILEVAAEGKSMARIDEIVTFVEGVVPGDVVDVLITKKRKNYWEGRPLRFVSYSAKRANARCRYFGVCGGLQMATHGLSRAVGRQREAGERRLATHWQGGGGRILAHSWFARGV